jgi:Anticodon-binding domain
MGNWTQVFLSPSRVSMRPASEYELIRSLQINTVTGQIHSGILLIHDPISQIIVLSTQSRSLNGVETPPSNSLVDLQIIKVSSIKDIRVLGPKQEGFKPYEAKPITVQDIKNREELAQKKVLDEEKRLGVGVTVEGQKIYDAFAKTYVSPSIKCGN